MHDKNFQHLMEGVESKLIELGFCRRAHATFGRQESYRTDLLLFGSRQDARSGDEKCSLNVGIYFPQVQEFIEAESDYLRPTIGIPLHLLTDQRKLFEWSLTEERVNVCADEMCFAIKRYAMPFFSTYGSVQAIRDTLIKDHPSEWFSMTPTRRAEILAACYCALNQREAGEAFIKAQIELNRDKLPKYRLPLERILRTLFGTK